MNTIFLGKIWHWALLIVATGLLWFSGSSRLHVIEFNWFMISLLIGTIVIVFTILRFHRPDEQVTRDKLVMQPFDPEAHTRIDGD